MAEYTWLHIGVGNFHRAHQAAYFNELKKLDLADTWHLVGGNLRNDSEATIEGLIAQKGRYTLETVTPKGERHYEEISSIERAIPWEEGLAPLIDLGAEDSTKVLAFTVTEAGYYFDNDGRLLLEDPAIKADLGGAVNTIYGLITKILEKRRETGANVTIVSCDNVRHNTEIFRNCLTDFLKAAGKEDLIEWMGAHTRTPMTMVDRITPRPTPDVAERVHEATGVEDRIPVMSESFIQWVIEDDFMDGCRPELEKVGAELVESVIPYEEAKIRILNAPHAGISWAGTLLGELFIHESVAIPAVRSLVYDYVTEDVIPSLRADVLDFAAYRDVVLERFSNPYIKDTNQRVSADGFSKIPAQIMPTVRDCIGRGHTPAATMKVIAVFYRFMEAWAAGKLPFDYFDGVMDPEVTRELFAGADPVAAFFSDTALFGSYAGKPEFLALATEALAAADELLS
ncbi:MAG: mannitol dehydrogenase family protein [Corynebacterium sp.]|nr:mannitol dehydrogenase family protein [Corynebacterium sp.]